MKIGEEGMLFMTCYAIRKTLSLHANVCGQFAESDRNPINTMQTYKNAVSHRAGIDF